MFFHESESIVREHPDLSSAIEQIDDTLSGITSSATLRPGDFSCALELEQNQVVAAFELFAQARVLTTEQVVECEQCQNLIPATDFQKAVRDEDPCECSSCGSLFSNRSKPFVVYAVTTEALARTQAKAESRAAETREQLTRVTVDEPLAERARCIIIAMLDLAAIDSDSLKTAAEIATRAFGSSADANSIKTVMSELRTRQLIDTKRGPGGGNWLTAAGKARAERHRSQ